MTDQITFEDELDAPPRIEKAPTGRRIGSILLVDKSQRSSWDMKALVHEPNINDVLLARWRIVSPLNNDDGSAPSFEQAPVPISGEVNRDLGFEVQTSELTGDSCHLLELAVSDDFVNPTNPPNFLFDVVKTEGSPVAYAIWWIWEGDPVTADYDRIGRSCDAMFIPPSAATVEEVAP